MNSKPNLLFLMTDQMQGCVLDSNHPCRTPNLDRLAQRGVRITRAYTPNAVCSPARASLMTGLLPHNHGVLEVTHCTDDDQSNLRPEKAHWAQRLQQNGYYTGYFGKWHVETRKDPGRYGWNEFVIDEDIREAAPAGPKNESEAVLSYFLDQPPGYRSRFYGTTETPVENRYAGVATAFARKFLDDAMQKSQPWCCFVSVLEPHDPFITARDVLETYDIDSIPLPPNVHDDMRDKPGLYRKAAKAFGAMTEQNHREAAACYYSRVTEIDGQFGRLLDQLEAAGQMENTLIVLTSDHGELLGAHGLYCKNVGAFEEVYNIPMVLAGPGVLQGAEIDARVGLHDLCPTLLAMTGSESIEESDACSFTPLLLDRNKTNDFQEGYAEYYGSRYRLTQKVVWDGPWKLVFNGFDEDELYNLEEDPHEMRNLIDQPQCEDRLQLLFRKLWLKIRDTGDAALWNSKYPPLRLARYGPDILQE